MVAAGHTWVDVGVAAAWPGSWRGGGDQLTTPQKATTLTVARYTCPLTFLTDLQLPPITALGVREARSSQQ
ncbi:hypothetical protein E2C01_090882 [Portunus trituberculatus]|uniref:Uncharacterized protein n=1 Tax=Portunus trituberculatus TaxID=210409 RepID=A0A5B7JHT6_PORTR|nr:hypothetical protein [Portunus trituberculatus]